MGTKFGSIHVKTGNQSEVLAALAEMAQLRQQHQDAGKSDNELLQLLQAASLQSRNTFYIGALTDGWLTILNDWLGWGESESLGEALSGFITAPVLTTSYFDDDVFQMTLYRNGERMTGQIWCTDAVAQDYELDREPADIALLTPLFGHDQHSRLLELLELNDCEEAVEKLERIANFPIWIHSAWFDEMNEQDWVGKYAKHELG